MNKQIKHSSEIYREIFIGLIVDLLMYVDFSIINVDTRHTFRFLSDTPSFEKVLKQIFSFQFYLKQEHIIILIIIYLYIIVNNSFKHATV